VGCRFDPTVDNLDRVLKHNPTLSIWERITARVNTYLALDPRAF